MLLRNKLSGVLTLAALAGVLTLAVATNSANADIIASTNFNGRTATGNVASNLSWTTDGVADPGNMAATVGGGAENLFDATALTQNNFTPGENYGNNGTTWLTSFGLTVLSGSTVTLDNVVFDYWAVNGGQAQNVTRAADFEVKVFDALLAQVGSTYSINDVSNGGTPGSGTTVTATFGGSIALTAAGTYTVQIEAGELGGTNETGNHAGIDDLIVNGTVSSSIPEPASLAVLGLGGLTMLVRRRRS